MTDESGIIERGSEDTKQKRKKRKEFKGIYVEAKWEPISSIIPYEKNPKLHPPEQVTKIANSIKRFNWDQPIVVDSNRVIIKGHGRYLAAKELGMDKVPIIIRTDMSDSKVRASRIADNQSAQSYWHIGNLLAEMETLYGMDAPLESTGYNLSEIRQLYPGLLETEEDFALTGDSDGTIPADLIHKGADGLVGKPIPKTGSGGTLTEWINSHSNIIVPFSGDRTGLAALCWCVTSGVDMSRVIIVDTFFGQRLWRWHFDYLAYVENTLGVKVTKSEDRFEEWVAMIKDRGWPSKEQPWCCNRLRNGALKAHYIKDPINSVIVWGQSDGSNNKPVYRQRGIMPDTSVNYAAPFYKQQDESLTAVIENLGVKLNPLYQITDLYLCPGCPRYNRPDFVFLKNHDLDLWIRWMVYFGKSQWNKEYLESDAFNDRGLELVGDNIEPREYGQYRKYAQSLPDCPQPDRDTIRKGDHYGWDLEVDKKLDIEGRLDRPRGAWWEEVGTSEAFRAMEDEVKAQKDERGDMPLEEWLTIKITEAKEQARLDEQAEVAGDN